MKYNDSYFRCVLCEVKCFFFYCVYIQFIRYEYCIVRMTHKRFHLINSNLLSREMVSHACVRIWNPIIWSNKQVMRETWGQCAQFEATRFTYAFTFRVASYQLSTTLSLVTKTPILCCSNLDNSIIHHEEH